jgi:hypothetical protein
VNTAEDVSAWIDGAGKAKTKVLGLFKQPVSKAKLAMAFRSAARTDADSSYALSAASKYDGKLVKYSPSPVESLYESSAPTVLVVKAGEGKAGVVTKCKLGRPTETSREDLAAGIIKCAHEAGGTKQEL